MPPTRAFPYRPARVITHSPHASAVKVPPLSPSPTVSGAACGVERAKWIYGVSDLLFIGFFFSPGQIHGRHTSHCSCRRVPEPKLEGAGSCWSKSRSERSLLHRRDQSGHSLQTLICTDIHHQRLGHIMPIMLRRSPRRAILLDRGGRLSPVVASICIFG